jgi:hypothetical protein
VLHVYLRRNKFVSNSCMFIEILYNVWESGASYHAASSSTTVSQDREPHECEPGSNLFTEQIHYSLNKHTFHHHSTET